MPNHTPKIMVNAVTGEVESRGAKLPITPPIDYSFQVWCKVAVMKHVLLAGLSVLASVGLDIWLHFFGAHDVGGLLAMMFGFPGLLANGDYTRLNEPLFVAVNAGFYFLVFEGIAALKEKLAQHTSPPTPD